MAENKPARGYSWPPFEKGNEAALKNGAHSERHIEPLAEALVNTVTDLAPWLTEPTFQPAVRDWARAQAVAELIFRKIDQDGLFDAEGKPVVSLEWVFRSLSKAQELRKPLGLDPASRAKLEREMADAGRSKFDLDALRREGAQIREGKAADE